MREELCTQLRGYGRYVVHFSYLSIKWLRLGKPKISSLIFVIALGLYYLCTKIVPTFDSSI